MKLLTLAILSTVLSTACGTAQPAAQADGTKPVATPASTPESTPVVDAPVKSQPADTSETAEKPAQITKDQAMRASIRWTFDASLANGKLFHDEVYKAYFFKGDEGVMGYPDSVYVPVTTKNLVNTCPLGFKQVGQIDLAIGQSHGLYDQLPPDSQWVWTSWKGTADPATSYNAQVTSDFTDAWGYSFVSQLFYPKHKSRSIGRLYCMMNEADLPNVDDLPPGYLDSLKGH